MNCLRIGACVGYEGDHITRHAGKNATYEVQLRSAATGIPILSVSARSGGGSSGIGVASSSSAAATSASTSSSSFAVPMHTHSGSDSAINFNATPAECIREAFDALAKPILSSVVLGDDPLGTIVVDSAGAPRNRIPAGMLELVLNFVNRSENVERVHASLVEIDSRGELIDVLDPSSPHPPRIDENFDAQSVHVANATLLDVGGARHNSGNRARVVRSVVAGKHSICTVIIRRRDGSLGSVTCAMLQVGGDGAKRNPQTSFRTVLHKVCDALSSVPVPASVPFSKSKLTFLLKGALCQTHPCAWIIALSPWYEVADEKETFADAATVVKSAAAVSLLTELATRSSSRSPQNQHHHSQQRAGAADSTSRGTSSSANNNRQHESPDKNAGAAAGSSSPSAAVDGRVLLHDARGGSDDVADAVLDNHVVISPESVHENATPQRTQRTATTTTTSKHHNQQQSQTSLNFSSLESSPIPKENSAVPQPTSRNATSASRRSQSNGNNTHNAHLQLTKNTSEAFVTTKSNSNINSSKLVTSNFYSATTSTNSNNNNNTTATAAAGGGAASSCSISQHQQLAQTNHMQEQHLRQLETLVHSLQGQLRTALHDQQQLKMRNASLSSSLSDADARATKCEGLLLALQQHGANINYPQMMTMTSHHGEQHSTANNTFAASSTATFHHSTNNNYSTGGGGASTISGGDAPLHRASSIPRHLMSPAIELPQSASQVIPNRSPSHSRSVSQEHHQSSSGTNQQQGVAVAPGVWSRAGSVSHHNSLVSNSAARRGGGGMPQQSNYTNDNSSSGNGGGAYYLQHYDDPPSNQQHHQQQQQQQPRHHSMPTVINVTDHSNDFVVVGYNFDLSEDEEAAVRREIEKRAHGKGSSSADNSGIAM